MKNIDFTDFFNVFLSGATIIGSLFFCAQREKKGARKSAANFFTLDYERILRNSTEMKIHFILSENGEERLASFRLIVSTAVEGCSYADGRRTYIVSARDSDAVSL